MRALLSLLLMAWAWCACGQGFGTFTHDQPFLSANPATTINSDPTNVVSTCIAWYLMTNSTTDGNNRLITVYDMSGNAYDAIRTQFVAPYKSNSTSSAWWLYPGSSAVGMSNSVPGVSQPNTVIVVACPVADSSRSSPYDVKVWNSSGANNIQFAFELLPGVSTRNAFMYAGAGVSSANNTMDNLTNIWTIYSVSYNGANSVLRTNGVMMVSGNAGASAWSNPGGIVFGGNDGLRAYSGGMRELIWVGTVTSNELFTLERNLARKWGITNSVVPGD